MRSLMQIVTSITEPDIVSTQPTLLSEEEGAFWLWAFPQLLAWDRPIRWLFSLTGGERSKGDLWGVDNAGNLLIVEGKRIPGERNPFRQLLLFERKRRETPQFAKLFEPTSIREFWRDRMEGESVFIGEQFSLIEKGIRPKREFRGVVPYSSRRFATLRWPTLYRKHIFPLFSPDSLYKRETESFLEQYERLGGPVHYIGLLVLQARRTPKLSSQGLADFAELKLLAGGAGFVHLRALSVENCDPSGTRFCGWREATGPVVKSST
jgi:hypothetical protein